MAGALKPFMPFSKMKPRIAPSSSLAHTTNTSAKGLLVIHILAPLTLKPPGTFLARVIIEAGSEPWLGSVKPKQPIHSPVASLGRYFCFCASVPKALMGTMTSELCTLIIER